jgi:hypothetical protein
VYFIAHGALHYFTVFHATSFGVLKYIVGLTRELTGSTWTLNSWSLHSQAIVFQLHSRRTVKINVFCAMKRELRSNF